MSRPLFSEVGRVINDPMLLLTHDGEILAYNPAALRAMAGLEVGGRLQALSREGEDAVRERLRRWMRTGDPVAAGLTFTSRSTGDELRCRCYGARAGWFEGGPAVQLRAVPADSTDGFMLLNERLSRESALRRNAERQRDRAVELEQHTRRQLFRLYTLTSALAAATTLRQVAEVVRTKVPEATDCLTAVLGLDLKRLIPEGTSPDRRLTLRHDPWVDLADDEPGLLAPVTSAVRVRSPKRPLSPYSPIAYDRDHHALLLPITCQNEKVGVLALAVERTSPPSRLEEEHLRTVAAQIGQALARAGVLEREFDISERLQRSLLPAAPELPGVATASRFTAGSDSMEVGGDWYDVFPLADGQVGFVIGDVAGHGPGEATLMGQLRSAMRASALRCGGDPAEMLGELDRYMAAYTPDIITTVCYLVLDERRGVLRYSNGGHPPPLLIRRDGEQELLEGALSPPLGASEEEDYQVASVSLEYSDTVVLYTDGLIERRYESLDTGLARIKWLAREAPYLSPEELCNQIMDGQDSDEYLDDQAVLVLRLREHTPAG
ncbi:SpoIIE family protein phosphatase [Bailinhaonella thermotolerans]|uniref:PPM-type phosphatase domain-containing protein n=1 Tax=Bailinhaonella thermotolerans TaxID=1070861 RepID=A0A3A4BPX3_9ACTN|nr:SpoIIE family protein phosphatase [Bailinhaonella thermotolerans]RJL33196.1 hypothetical protein D5H75_10155 [Bailinhaonella thermotolerans]